MKKLESNREKNEHIPPKHHLKHAYEKSHLSRLRCVAHPDPNMQQIKEVF